MTNPHPSLLPAERTVLLVVDVQERFEAAIPNFSAIVEHSVRLVRAFDALGLPVLVSEQYPKGLGRTVAPLRDVLGATEPFEKTCFSALGSRALAERMTALRARQVLLAGIEAHVCVSQTAHELLQRGMSVHVAVDAVGSRKDLDRDVALRRLERVGAVLTTAEAAAFELLADATHPEFKAVQALFK